VSAAVDELKNKNIIIIIIIIINKNNTTNNYSKSLVLVTQLNLFRQLTFCVISWLPMSVIII